MHNINHIPTTKKGGYDESNAHVTLIKSLQAIPTLPAQNQVYRLFIPIGAPRGGERGAVSLTLLGSSWKSLICDTA